MINILKEYIEKRINLLKLNAMEQSARISGLIYFLVIALVFLIFFIAFLILGIGLLIGSLLGNYAYGLLLMSLGCLLVFILLLNYRKSIQRYASDTFVKFLNN